MYLLTKSIKIIIVTLILASCSLSQPVKLVEKNSSEGNVKVAIHRINPTVAEKTVNNNTRAYYAVDKLVLRVFDSSNVLFETYTYDTRFGNIEASLVLPVGNYTIEGDVYNNKNSISLPVVSGVSSVFTVVEGVMSNVNITMKPNNPEVISLGDVKSVSGFEYTGFNIDGNFYTGYGTEHWYSITADSAITELSIINNSITYSNKYLTPFECSVYDMNGNYVFSREKSDGKIIIETNPGETYYLLIAPMKYEASNVFYYSNNIEFSVKNYEDTNVSEATAEVVSQGYISGNYFTGPTDIDYYKMTLTAGTYFFESGNSVLMQVTDSYGVNINILETSLGHIGHVVIPADGVYFLHLTRHPGIDSDPYSYSFGFQKQEYVSTVNPSDLWIEGDFTNDSRRLYKLNVDSSKEYQFKLDDNNYGSGLYDSSVNVKIYRFEDNQSTGIIEYSYYFSSYSDDCYNVLKVIDFPSDVTEVILEISDDSNWGGSFAFQVSEFTPPVPTTVPVSTLREVNSVDGDYQYFSVPVDSAKTYKFTINDFFNSSYDGLFNFSLYTSDRTNFYHENIVSGDNIIINPEAGYSEVIIKVNSGLSSGTVAFKLDEVVTP